MEPPSLTGCTCARPVSGSCRRCPRCCRALCSPTRSPRWEAWTSCSEMWTAKMTFSPQLEERFAKMLQSYPEGRRRSAVVPMLIYAQDETGAVTPELIEEVAKRCEVAPLQVDEVVG